MVKKERSVEAARDVEDELIVVVEVKSMSGGDELISCEVGAGVTHGYLFRISTYLPKMDQSAVSPLPIQNYAYYPPVYEDIQTDISQSLH